MPLIRARPSFSAQQGHRPDDLDLHLGGQLHRRPGPGYGYHVGPVQRPGPDRYHTYHCVLGYPQVGAWIPVSVIPGA